MSFAVPPPVKEVAVRKRAALAAGVSVVSLLAASCMEPVHPLDRDGQVSLWSDVEGPLYAVRMEESGPVSARQRPFGKNFTIQLTENGKPGFGAYVDVRVDPPPALLLLPSDGSCEQQHGAFRCVGSKEGYASFRVETASDWSSVDPARIVVSWADNTHDSTQVRIKPPGLPLDSLSFELISSALPTADAKYYVPPSYNEVKCTVTTSPEPGIGPSWSATPRIVNMLVRATGPLGTPGVVENAPVHVTSSSIEGRLSFDKSCNEDSASALDFELDSNGEGPPFYLCVSNVGGDFVVAAASGELSGDDASASPRQREFRIAPEPQVIRVVPVQKSAVLGDPLDFEITAYGHDPSLPLDLKVDLESKNSLVMDLDARSAVLSEDPRTTTRVAATAVGIGDAVLLVRPSLHEDKTCESEPIPVGAGIP